MIIELHINRIKVSEVRIYNEYGGVTVQYLHRTTRYMILHVDPLIRQLYQDELLDKFNIIEMKI